MQDRADISSPSASGAYLLERVRSFVHELLKEGVPPAEISYALAFVATELGLTVAEDPMGVFPVVLSGVAQAAATHLSEQEERADGPDDQTPVPNSDTIH